MTEEVKNTEIQQECFCKKRFKDVLVVAIGSFVGVYCALSLFAALHRPPCPMGFGPRPGAFHGAIMHHKQMPEKFKHPEFKGDFEKMKPEELGNK